MGVRFDRLLGESRSVLERILKQKEAQEKQAQAVAEGFSDQPTRVAPADLVDDLNNQVESEDSASGQGQATPFQNDIADFPEEAFEESTKVASILELAAQNSAIDLFAEQGPNQDDEFLAGTATGQDASSPHKAEDAGAADAEETTASKESSPPSDGVAVSPPQSVFEPNETIESEGESEWNDSDSIVRDPTNEWGGRFAGR